MPTFVKPWLSSATRKVGEANQKLNLVKKEIAKVIVGQKELLNRLLIAILADGHILLEGVPEIAKTLAVNSFSKSLKLDFKRIQFTADRIGASIYTPKKGNLGRRSGCRFLASSSWCNWLVIFLNKACFLLLQKLNLRF